MIRIKISELLGKNKMKQADLARKANIRPSTLSSFYNETCKYIAVEHLDNICKALNCSISDIVEYVPDNE